MEIQLKELHGRNEILKALLSLGDSLFDQTINTKEQLEKLSLKYSQRANVLTISKGNRTIGLCAYYDNDETEKAAYISMLVIDRNEQRKGYGTNLLREVTDRCIKRQKHSISLSVSSSNAAAVQFYLSKGFNQFEGNDRAYIYKKELIYK